MKGGFTDPLNDETSDPFTSDEVKMLIALAVLTVMAVVVFSLGFLCATHRIGAAVLHLL